MSIPFFVPNEYASGIASGNIIRIGSLLKDRATGKILGHLQESGMVQNLIQAGMHAANLSPVSSLVGAANLASSVYTNTQVIQLKAMVASLSMMQFATLGAILSGIGLSVCGFVLINKKIKALEQQLQQHIITIKTQIDAHFKDKVERETRVHFSHIQTLLNESQEMRHLRNSYNGLTSTASRFAEESGYFKGELLFILEQDKFDDQLFGNFLQAMFICNSARLECFILLSEYDTAHTCAKNIGQDLDQLSYKLEPAILTEKNIEFNALNKKVSNVQYRSVQEEMSNFVNGVRDATEVAQTKPYLLDILKENHIDGHDYIRILQNEKKHPLLILPSTIGCAEERSASFELK